MKRAIFSILFVFSVTTEVYASCPWGANTLGMEIKSAGDLLTNYGTCRSNCKTLETDLTRSVAKMSKASACGAHIATANNRYMINFIASRFKLIQKQKAGSAWSKTVTTGSAIASASQTVRKPAPRTAVPTRRAPSQAAPQSASGASEALPQTKMVISPEAYAALWLEDVVQIKPRHGNNQAQQKQLAQQRLIQQRKHALIQEQRLQYVRAKKRIKQQQLNQQRALRHQRVKQRALLHRLNQQKVRQQKLAQAQRLRKR